MNAPLTTPATTPATTPDPAELSVADLLMPAVPTTPELTEALRYWTQTRDILVGTILKQFGRRACEIKVGELKRFAKENRVVTKTQPDGSLRYETIKLTKKET